MILRIFLLFFVFFISYVDAGGPSEMDRVSDNLIIKLSKKVKKEGLLLVGIGGACTIDEKISSIDGIFNYSEVLDIETGRKLIVDCTTLLLELINSDPKNKLYFEKFPADPAVIYIAIHGQKPHEPNGQFINIAKIIKSQIYYKIIPSVPQFPLFITAHEESFEDAKAILSKQPFSSPTYKSRIEDEINYYFTITGN
jgi:hypothetical protein